MTFDLHVALDRRKFFYQVVSNLREIVGCSAESANLRYVYRNILKCSHKLS